MTRGPWGRDKYPRTIKRISKFLIHDRITRRRTIYMDSPWSLCTTVWSASLWSLCCPVKSLNPLWLTFSSWKQRHPWLSWFVPLAFSTYNRNQSNHQHAIQALNTVSREETLKNIKPSTAIAALYIHCQVITYIILAYHINISYKHIIILWFAVWVAKTHKKHITVQYSNENQ